MALVAMLDNRWGEDELAAKLGRVLDLNGRRDGLGSQTMSVLAGAMPLSTQSTEQDMP